MAIWVIALVVASLPPILWSLDQIDMHNDVSKWLPSDDPQARTLAWYQSNFPTPDRALVSWDDCSLTDPRLRQVAENLEGRKTVDGTREGTSPFVSSVALPY